MRLFIKLGAPLEVNGIRYKDKMDRIEEQDAIIESFLVDIRENTVAKFKDDPTGFRVYIINQLLFLLGIADASKEVMLYMSFAVLFVICYFRYHLGSFLLAFLGLFLIGISFPLTVIITNGIF